jgi:ATP-dependent helicase/DNAse subunit B
VLAVAQALDGDPRLLAGLFSSEAHRPLAAALDAGMRIVHARARGESFGAAEGLLTSPAAAARLTQRFGPQHPWSPSQWETYAACPYKFFLQGVLGLEPLGDLVLETDFARRGSRLHHILATFHRQWPTVCNARPLTAAEEPAVFLDCLQKVIEEQMAVTSRVGIDAALLELDRRQISRWAAKHFDHHRKYDGDCTKLGGRLAPQHFEFRFGPARPGDTESDTTSVKDAFVIKTGGEEIRVIGQIDRIDVGNIDGKTYFSVIDYKSGKKAKLTEAHIESGERLQLPIYVEAAQALVFHGKATPLAAGYWSMTAGFDAKGALAAAKNDDNGERWEKVRETVHRLVGKFVGDIRHGDFPVASRDDKCTSYCEFSTVCRVTQIRSLNKTRANEPEQK